MSEASSICGGEHIASSAIALRSDAAHFGRRRLVIPRIHPEFGRSRIARLDAGRTSEWELEALYIREVMVFLVAAGVIIPLFRRLRISPVLGFLIVGLVIGPFGLGRFAENLPWLGYLVISDIEGVRAFAELGVMFLLFMIGLELSVDRLWAMRRLVFGLGGAQSHRKPGAVIALIAAAFDNPPAVAVILGGGLALSSTAIVMQLLAENRRLGTAGRSNKLFHSAVPGLGGAADPVPGRCLWGPGRGLGGACLRPGHWRSDPGSRRSILVLGRLVIRPLFRFIGSDASRETFPGIRLVGDYRNRACHQRGGPLHGARSLPGRPVAGPKPNTATRSRSTSNRLGACCWACSLPRSAWA